MSGRVKVTLASGRKVTGYRKTDRERIPETRARAIPAPWDLSFIAPHQLFLAPGPTGVIGVTVVAPGPRLVATGVNREWVFGQVRAFLDRIDAPPFQTMACCRRASQQASRCLTYTPGKPLEWGKE